METGITNKAELSSGKKGLLSVTYALLPEDYFAWWDHSLEKKTGCLFEVLQVSCFLFLVWVWLSVFGPGGQIADFGIVGLIIFVIALMSFKTLPRRLRYWLWMNVGKKDDYFRMGRRDTVWLSTEGIIQETDFCEDLEGNKFHDPRDKRFSWGAVKSIDLDYNFQGDAQDVFIQLSEHSPIIVPKRAFSTEKELEGFAKEAKHLWEVFLAIGPTPIKTWKEDDPLFSETRIKSAEDSEGQIRNYSDGLGGVSKGSSGGGD
jgi:hypothetical protein